MKILNKNGDTIREVDAETLREANLREANLTGADLSGARLSGAYLCEANLSGAKGLLDPSEWLNQFEHDADGIIVYRMQHGKFRHPSRWKWEPGLFLTEVPNPDRCSECGCGVSFATIAWLKKHNENLCSIWKCRIRWMDLAGVVVPYNTDGKARCARLELLEIEQRPER